MKHNCLSKRDFLITSAKATFSLYILGLTSYGKIGQLSRVLTDEIIVDLSLPENSALKTTGGAQYVKLDGDTYPLIVIRNSEAKVSAFTSKCTHQGGKVQLPVNKVCTCPTHGAQYNDTGAVIKGPATMNLPYHSATLDGDTIHISADPVSIKKESIGTAQQSRIRICISQPAKTISVEIPEWEKPALIKLFNPAGSIVREVMSDTQGKLLLKTSDLASGRYILYIKTKKDNFRHMFSIE